MENAEVLLHGNRQTVGSNEERSPGKGALAVLGLVAVATCFFAGSAFAADQGELTEPGKGRVLVAFATSKGSTAEIAEAIASEIRSAGRQAEAVDLRDSPIPSEYDHVILGGPIYYGKIKEVKAFVDKHGTALENLIAGAFAVGMAFAGDNEEQAAAGRKALDESLAPLKPANLAYFAGKIDPGKLSLIEKAAIKMVKSPVGDFRDWDAVRDWARKVAESLN